MATVFYSWQSDLPGNTNRGFIGDSLRKALRDLAKDEDVYEPPRDIDTATAGVAGSARIDQKIFEKIDAASACVFDVSIALRSENRVSPNPNVLVELGYALKAHPEARVIMVLNKRFGKPEELPFDLRQRQVMVYDAVDVGSDERPKAKADLVAALVGALKATFAHNHANRFTQAEVECFTLLYNNARALLNLHAEFEDRRLKPYADRFRDQCKDIAGCLRELANLDQAHSRPELLAQLKRVADGVDAIVGFETFIGTANHNNYVATVDRAATDAIALLEAAKDAVRQRIASRDYGPDKRQAARAALADFARLKSAVGRKEATHLRSIRESMQSVGAELLRLSADLEVLGDEDAKILRPAGHALHVAAIEKSQTTGYAEVEALVAKLGPLLEPFTKLAKVPGA